MFTACMSGLYLIGIVKDIGVQLAGLNPAVAGNAVAMVAIFNTSVIALTIKMPQEKVSKERASRITKAVSNSYRTI